MSLEEKQRVLIEDLNLIPDPQERLSAVVSGAARVKIAEEHKVDANLVPGCVSRVWLHGAVVDGHTQFRCDADSPIVKGLAALLCELYSGTTPAEAATIEPHLWEDCGFTKLLSPTRLNGLANVRGRIRGMAMLWSGAASA